MPREVEEDKGGKRDACLISAWLHANLPRKLAVNSIPETSLRREFPSQHRLSSWPARPSRSTFISAWERQCWLVYLPSVVSSVLWRTLITPEPTSRLAELLTSPREPSLNQRGVHTAPNRQGTPHFQHPLVFQALNWWILKSVGHFHSSCHQSRG